MSEIAIAATARAAVTQSFASKVEKKAPIAMSTAFMAWRLSEATLSRRRVGAAR
jgi:hypothetical protein